MANKKDSKLKRGFMQRALASVGSSGDILPFVRTSAGINNGNSNSSSHANKKQQHSNAHAPRPKLGRSRSGGFLPESFKYKDRRDASAKRRYRVQLPTRMLRYVFLIFLALPLFLFVYREMHVHDDTSAHYKAERTAQVDTKQALSLLSQNRTASLLSINTTSLSSMDEKAGVDAGEEKDVDLKNNNNDGNTDEEMTGRQQKDSDGSFDQSAIDEIKDANSIRQQDDGGVSPAGQDEDDADSGDDPEEQQIGQE